jgi:signal transduction histidine kinase
MTGRVFLVLLLGIVASAALTQWLAVNERTRALERYRDFHALERAEQLITTADVMPESARPTFLVAASRGTVRLEMSDMAQAQACRRRIFHLAAAAPGRALQAGPAGRTSARLRPAAPGQQHLRADPVARHLRNHERAPARRPDPQAVGAAAAPAAGLAAQRTAVAAPFLLSIAFLAYLVARMTIKPLKRLAQAAKDLGNDINHPPVALSGASEIRQASAAFNAMQARIRQHITQRTQMLAAITHDLQTPLTRLRLRLEKVSDPELQQRLIDDLSAMQQMVKEGLDLARSMDSTETMQALDLDALLDSVCSDATDVGQQVELRGRAAMALMGRPLAIRRCLVNLIDNAVKYGHYANVTVERLVARRASASATAARHCRRPDGARVRTVLPHRDLALARVRRHRPGADHRPQHRRAAWRQRHAVQPQGRRAGSDAGGA